MSIYHLFTVSKNKYHKLKNNVIVCLTINHIHFFDLYILFQFIFIKILKHYHNNFNYLLNLNFMILFSCSTLLMIR